MLNAGPPELVHLVGFLTGAALFGMLLLMVARPPARPDAFALATAILGLVWNVGELAEYAVIEAGLATAAPWMAAASFTALGLLASVVVHSVARSPERADQTRHTVGVFIAVLVYGCALLAGLMHFWAAGRGQTLPSSTGLTTLTVGLAATIPFLVVVTRHQINSTRALWMAALALFAVSALHLGRFHGTQESWPVEIVGHHASIVLAFAILYQDYRFALADLFLKHALTLIGLVVLVFAGFSLVEPLLSAGDGLSSTAISVLLSLWAGTALLFPALRALVNRFVDRVILTRADYTALVARLGETVQRCDTSEAVLDSASELLRPALTATSITWKERTLLPATDSATHEAPVLTGEAPQYVLVIGSLAGGRRLLSDDLAMLERVTFLLARRIDALRLTSERYERVLREREMHTLATEAELRALRAQINPHFLFNALTTIGYLIQHAPVRALDTLLGLTTLLRSVLRSEGEFTTLGRERELIECYLRIEQERFEERLTFALDIPDHLYHLSVPSLVVQSLVENAVKHGISPAKDGGRITVTARMAADLTITVRNTGMPFAGRQPTPGSGIGLENVERRLHHYYGADASLVVARDDDGTTVAELRLPVTDIDDEPFTLTADMAARQ